MFAILGKYERARLPGQAVKTLRFPWESLSMKPEFIMNSGFVLYIYNIKSGSSACIIPEIMTLQ